MNVQLSLAYFNDKDFEKACELLSSKGFNFDVPVDATQFSTFKFYSEQKINSSNYAKAKETRELLINNGSEDLYVLIAMTGKNPIAPFQWVNISDCFATVISSRFKITESEYTNGFKYMMVEFKKTKISNENFPI